MFHESDCQHTEDACSVTPDLQLGTLFLTLKNNALSLSERIRGYFTVNALYKLPAYLLTFVTFDLTDWGLCYALRHCHHPLYFVIIKC